MKEVGKYGNVIFINDPSVGIESFRAGGKFEMFFKVKSLGPFKKNIEALESYTAIPTTYNLNTQHFLIPETTAHDITWVSSGKENMAEFLEAYHHFCDLAETNE